MWGTNETPSSSSIAEIPFVEPFVESGDLFAAEVREQEDETALARVVSNCLGPSDRERNRRGRGAHAVRVRGNRLVICHRREDEGEVGGDPCRERVVINAEALDPPAVGRVERRKRDDREMGHPVAGPRRRARLIGPERSSAARLRRSKRTFLRALRAPTPEVGVR